MRVRYDYRSRVSGEILARALRDTPGKTINWGYSRGGEVNPDEAVRLASNKRLALLRMRESGIPIPNVQTLTVPNNWQPVQALTSNRGASQYPVIGRPDHHKGGSGFYFCRTYKGIRRAMRKGATHFIEFIPDAREFRVHIVNGKSIKLAEKIGEGNRKNFKRGAYFIYPQDFNHKKTLRKIARNAVMSLGLDFGAVDILYKDGSYFVLEVNSAPSLTSASDVLERYVKAFKDNYGVMEEE